VRHDRTKKSRDS